LADYGVPPNPPYVDLRRPGVSMPDFGVFVLIFGLFSAKNGSWRLFSVA